MRLWPEQLNYLSLASGSFHGVETPPYQQNAGCCFPPALGQTRASHGWNLAESVYLGCLLDGQAPVLPGHSGWKKTEHKESMSLILLRTLHFKSQSISEKEGVQYLNELRSDIISTYDDSGKNLIDLGVDVCRCNNIHIDGWLRDVTSESELWLSQFVQQLSAKCTQAQVHL